MSCLQRECEEQGQDIRVVGESWGSGSMCGLVISGDVGLLDFRDAIFHCRARV